VLFRRKKREGIEDTRERNKENIIKNNNNSWASKNKKHVTVYTHEGRIIREACNHIPMGICLGTLEGIPRLSNESMQELARIITSANMTNTKVFWYDLCNFKGNSKAEHIEFTDTPSVRLSNGRVINFTKKRIMIKQVEHVEIIASDVTDKYELSCKLKSENDLLRKQAEELERLRENIAILNRDEEVLESKMRVHYELGRVILSSRRYLAGEASIDKEELMDMWDEALGVFEHPLFSEKASFDFIGELKAMALSNGCNLKFEGCFDPENEMHMTIVREGLVNSVRHGNATEIVVYCEKESDEIAGVITDRIKIVDNGTGIPDNSNYGGLEDLNTRIKETGGSMTLYNRQDAKGAVLEAIVVENEHGIGLK